MNQDYLARCPYYVYERGRSVCCEGLCEGMLVSMSFAVSGAKRKHKWRYCRSQWAACPWAQAQNRRYNYCPPQGNA